MFTVQQICAALGLCPFCGRRWWLGKGVVSAVDLWSSTRRVQVDAVDNIAPLIRSAHLQQAAISGAFNSRKKS